jgi:hypothetical protein
LNIVKNGVSLTKWSFLRNLILFFAFFAFYFVFSLNVLPQAATLFVGSSMLQASFSLVIAATLVFSSFLLGKLKKEQVICASLILTTALTVLLIFVLDWFFGTVLIFLIGIFFGIGQLAYFTYFWESTIAEERGRIGGLIGLISLIFYFVMIEIIIGNMSFSEKVLVAIIPSLVAMATLLIAAKKATPIKRKLEMENHPEKRTVLLYSIPWILFSLINATLAKNILNSSQWVPSSYVILGILQFVAAFIGAFGGGLIADFFGRRLTLALSVTLYGVSMALSGVVQNLMVYSIVFAAEGLSWGILLTLYSFVIWGDMANKKNCAMMYSIGLIAFYVATSVGQLPMSISQIPPVDSALIGCSLIFLSNVPIALAPELLSSDFQERIKLKMHMNALRRLSKRSQNHG